jgi:ElaB/YqjD/DUF883 family membrane-anchored ribosome-binding protein
MAAEPDQIRNDIEATRADLASNVDQLADRTSPSRIARRSWSRVSDKVHSLSDSVMGAPSSTAGSAKQKVNEAGDKIGSMTSETADKVRQAPHLAAQGTRGNPLAAGLIAFGAGLLAAAMIPESEAERRITRQLADSELAEQVRQPLAESAGKVGQDLAEEIKESGQQVMDSAKDHASTAVEEAKGTAQRAKQDTTR